MVIIAQLHINIFRPLALPNFKITKSNIFVYNFEHSCNFYNTKQVLNLFFLVFECFPCYILNLMSSNVIQFKNKNSQFFWLKW